MRKHRDEDRTDQLHAIAGDLGIPLVTDYDGTLPGIGKLSRGSLLRQGRDRRIRNMLRNQADDGELIFFDYEYTIVVGGSDGRSSSHTHRQSIIYFRSPALSLPQFTLRPKSLLDKVMGVFLSRYIKLKQNAQFSRSYCLMGDDQSRIRVLFNLHMLAFFGTVEKVSVEAAGEVFIMYRENKHIQPDKLKRSLQEALQLFALLREKPAA